MADDLSGCTINTFIKQTKKCMSITDNRNIVCIQARYVRLDQGWTMFFRKTMHNLEIKIFFLGGLHYFLS